MYQLCNCHLLERNEFTKTLFASFSISLSHSFDFFWHPTMEFSWKKKRLLNGPSHIIYVCMFCKIFVANQKKKIMMKTNWPKNSIIGKIKQKVFLLVDAIFFVQLQESAFGRRRVCSNRKFRKFKIFCLKVRHLSDVFHPKCIYCWSDP